MDERLDLINRVLGGAFAAILVMFLIAVLSVPSRHSSTHVGAFSYRPPPAPRELLGPNQEGGTPRTQATKSNEASTEKEPVAVKLIPSEKTEAETRKEKYETEEKPALDRGLTSYTGWLVFFTALLFISASIQAGLFIWQLLLIRESLKDGARSADAAEASASTADRSLKSLERAFIFVDSHYMQRIEFPRDDPDRPFIFGTIWKNGGRSWTVRGINQINFGWDVNPLPEDFEFKDNINTDQPRSSFVIGPGASMNGASLKIPHDVITRVVRGQIKLYIWGWCEYNDVFPDTRRHRTEFCVRVEPFDVQLDGEIGKRKASFRFLHHHKYNSADENCLNPVQT